uniref:Uncharacterized protein n=1 Tax=Schistosoma japonicum TaxID=6182 RepID=Q5BQW7_SCHJA|nr:unknown [Schistosoma japonicum]
MACLTAYRQSASGDGRRWAMLARAGALGAALAFATGQGRVVGRRRLQSDARACSAWRHPS